MKQTTINVQITKNLGNYESVRLGGEWSLDEGEDATQAYTDALNELQTIYGKMFHVEQLQPKEQPKTDGKQVVDFDTPILQSICSRVSKDKAVSMETIEKYYTLTDKARKVVEMAIKMR